MTPADALIIAGENYPGARLFEGTPEPLLASLATYHAGYMAKTRRQGYQGWAGAAGRFRAILDRLDRLPSEICVKSGNRPYNGPLQEIAVGMFNSWKQLEGCWAVVKRQWEFYGVGMAQGSNGIWYACVILA